ncbi:lytic polysaccharide monooxygenase [Patellaria atrata CBS 101060]|uniref:AA9 family lytic polysaccharide monooxygenase n=1 Tax=Patellaria atrata CBS 101060 TaxID=1346257 RepID=A0A9P4SHR4_9PEZI|nr:lytic polysaccharide monooxygenase [Patellaria atrata CBS 101060]
MLLKAFSIAASLTLEASAHGGISRYFIEGKEYPGNVPYAAAATQQNTIQRRWWPDPIYDIKHPSMTCNRNSDPGTSFPSLHAPIAAGGNITNSWVHCKGGIVAYIAACNGPCEDFDGKGKVWFKIYEGGLLPGGKVGSCDWEQPDATHYGWETPEGKVLPGWTVKIPENLRPGNYLIRHEIMMIELSPIQMYPNCANLRVEGTGDAFPGEEYLVEFPGAYELTDPGIAIAGTVYYPESRDLTNYTIPGPKVWQG